MAKMICTMIMAATLTGCSLAPIKATAKKMWVQKPSSSVMAKPQRKNSDVISDISNNLTIMTDVSEDQVAAICKGALSGKASVIIASARKHGVNPVFAAAVIAHESALGTSRLARQNYNFGGLKNRRGKYANFSEMGKNAGIDQAVKCIAKWSARKKTMMGMAPIYVHRGAAHWMVCVKKHMATILSANPKR